MTPHTNIKINEFTVESQNFKRHVCFDSRIKKKLNYFNRAIYCSAVFKKIIRRNAS